MFQDKKNQNKDVQREINKKNDKYKGIFKSISAGVVGSVLTLTIVAQTGFLQTEEPANLAVEEPIAEEQTVNSTSDINIEQVTNSSSTTADIVEQTSQAIVGITNIQVQQSNPFYSQGFGQHQNQESEEIESGTGSGVIYQVTDDALYIITNHHVIEDASTIEVTLYTEETVTAELIGSDSLTDLAVLKVEGEYDITSLAFGDSSELRAGEEVIAIGNPLGLDLYGTVTQGIVSAVDRTIEASTSAGVWDMEVIQTDAAINPGNSGGALINTSGELVGINSMKIADNDVEGLGFAIPSNNVTTIIDQLMENGQIIRPYLGITMANISDLPYYTNTTSSEITDGVIITAIDENGGAAQAGLQIEDIIVSINNQNVATASNLRKYLYSELSVGDVVNIQFYRQGELQEANVTLSSN